MKSLIQNFLIIGLSLIITFFISCKEQKITEVKNKLTNEEVEKIVSKEIDNLYEVYIKSDLKWVDFYQKKYTIANTDGSITENDTESLRKYWADVYSKYDVTLRNHGKPTIIASTDQALSYNSYDEILISKETKDTIVSLGTWVVLWKQQKDETWKINFETYHSEK